MGTTTGGLPYPEPTDPVAGGADAIKALANVLDPPWLAPSFGSGWASLSNYPTRYRIIGNSWLVLSGTAYYAGGVPALSTLMTLPRGCTVDDTLPYAAGCLVAVTNRTGTWTAGNAYLDIRAAGSIVCHVATVVAALDALHLDGVTFRIKAS